MHIAGLEILSCCATTRVEDGLYVIKFTQSLSCTVSNNTMSSSAAKGCEVVHNSFPDVNLQLFHSRLGHSSLSKFSHLDAYTCCYFQNFICDVCHEANFIGFHLIKG